MGKGIYKISWRYKVLYDISIVENREKESTGICKGSVEEGIYI